MSLDAKLCKIIVIYYERKFLEIMEFYIYLCKSNIIMLLLLYD